MKINTTHLTPKQLLKNNYTTYKNLYPTLKQAGENWLEVDDAYDAAQEIFNLLQDAILPTPIEVDASCQAGIGPITHFIEGDYENGTYYQWNAIHEEQHFTDSLITTNNFDDFITKLSNFYYNILTNPDYFHQGEWHYYAKP